jgi:nudix-type nucleoside diphosphatase (YffH/AdpP family)
MSRTTDRFRPRTKCVSWNHDDSILLCEQFRAPTLDKDSGWLVEVPAGVLESGEDPAECARRETIEETGYAPRSLRRIACVYLSPGGSSERIHLFYAEVSLADEIGAGGGLTEEGEDIRLIRLPVKEAVAKAAAGEIQDAKHFVLTGQATPGFGSPGSKVGLDWQPKSHELKPSVRKSIPSPKRTRYRCLTEWTWTGRLGSSFSITVIC